MKRKNKSRVLLALLLIILGAIAYKALPYVIIDFTKFDFEVWDKYDMQRHKMIDDLESRYTLVGMTKEEIIALLGERHSWYRDAFEIQGWPMRAELSYAIGRGLIDLKRYDIGFDENGNCIYAVRFRD